MRGKRFSLEQIIRIIKDLKNKLLTPEAKKAAVVHVISNFGRSERETYRLVNVSRSANSGDIHDKKCQEENGDFPLPSRQIRGT